MDNEPMREDLYENYNTRKKKNKRGLFLKIVLVLVAIIVALAGVLVGYAYSRLYKVNYHDIDENQIVVNEGLEEATGYRNIVLYGVHDRNNSYIDTISDTIMIVSINQDTKEVKIASVYRDTYLKNGEKYDKVNHAFRGGPTESMSVLNTNLDLNLNEYVAINFNVVVDVIDSVGGVEIEIKKDILKYINLYIDEVNRLTGHNSEHINEVGTYNLDGVQALAYARIRYISGGDYERARHQRDILNLVFEKVKKMNVMEINNIANQILPQISTNIPPNQILALLTQVTSYDIKDTTGWPFEIKDYQPADVWYGAPVNLERQVTKLHEYLFNEEDYVPSNTVKSISNELIRKTGYK